MAGDGAALPSAADGAVSGQLEVWAVDPVACGPALIEAEHRNPRLPVESRAGEWRRDSQRTAAHIALRILLERAMGRGLGGVPFEVTRAGKPSLPGGAISFSLSHCDGRALIAIDTAGGPLGVDVERIDRRLGSLAGRRARIEAMAMLLARGRPLSLGGDASAMQAWVRLEAFAKADGAGIAVLLSRLGIIGTRISDTEAAARAQALVVRDVAVTLDDLDLGGEHVAALARDGRGATPAINRFPERPIELERLLVSAGP